MKKSFQVVLGLMALLSAMVLRAQTPAAKPGPEHEKLMKIWVGDLTYEGESSATPLGPAGKSVGKATVRPLLGGFFVEWRGEEKGPAGTFSWFEVDGYDALNKRFFWTGFGSDGNLTSVTYSINGTTMDYSGTLLLGEKQFKIRGNVVFAADFMSWVEKRELSVDGQTWMPNFQSKTIKTKKSQ
jgi:Protein of unknown function (DUF1579)